jgi:multidrug efflux pump subunit AcrB
MIFHFQAMSERQQALAAEILKDPAVESLSSFIGIDANNPKLSNGRILINLKSHAEREGRSSYGTSAWRVGSCSGYSSLDATCARVKY